MKEPCISLREAENVLINMADNKETYGTAILNLRKLHSVEAQVSPDIQGNNNEINRVVVELTDWSRRNPTGSIAFSYGDSVASEYCDTVEDFKKFFEEIKPNLCADAILEVRMDMTDLNDSCRHDSCTDIIGFALDIRAAFYEVTGGAL